MGHPRRRRKRRSEVHPLRPHGQNHLSSQGQPPLPRQTICRQVLRFKRAKIKVRLKRTITRKEGSGPKAIEAGAAFYFPQVSSRRENVRIYDYYVVYVDNLIALICML